MGVGIRLGNTGVFVEWRHSGLGPLPRESFLQFRGGSLAPTCDGWRRSRALWFRCEAPLQLCSPGTQRLLWQWWGGDRRELGTEEWE